MKKALSCLFLISMVVFSFAITGCGSSGSSSRHHDDTLKAKVELKVPAIEGLEFVSSATSGENIRLLPAPASTSISEDELYIQILSEDKQYNEKHEVKYDATEKALTCPITLELGAYTFELRLEDRGLEPILSAIAAVVDNASLEITPESHVLAETYKKEKASKGVDISDFLQDNSDVVKDASIDLFEVIQKLVNFISDKEASYTEYSNVIDSVIDTSSFNIQYPKFFTNQFVTAPPEALKNAEWSFIEPKDLDGKKYVLRYVYDDDVYEIYDGEEAYEETGRFRDFNHKRWLTVQGENNDDNLLPYVKFTSTEVKSKYVDDDDDDDDDEKDEEFFSKDLTNSTITVKAGALSEEITGIYEKSQFEDSKAIFTYVDEDGQCELYIVKTTYNSKTYLNVVNIYDGVFAEFEIYELKK